MEALLALEQSAQPLPWTDDQLFLEMAHNDGQVWGAVDEDDQLLGYVAVRRIVDEAWIMNVAVAPVARRRGLGRELVEAACVVARTLGCSTLWLEVREENAGARALYEAAGFQIRGRRPGYYRPIPPAMQPEAAIVMARSVV
jgi:ribosomal-protein-alanine N-acetyltransferase